jgi:hypothetical protein
MVLMNKNGLPNATLNLANAVDAIQLGDDKQSFSGSYKIGALTGKGTLGYGSGSTNTYEIGALGKDFTFNGIINAGWSKVGAGTMITTANTGTGAVTVKEGTLQADNVGATTSSTGKASLTVEDGAVLTGRGYIGNSGIAINAGGTFRPGRNYASTLTVGCNVNISEGGVMEFRINSSNNSSVTIEKVLLFKGTLRILAVSSKTFKAGDTFTFWTCKTYNKNYTPTLELPELPEGLEWDTSELFTTTGTLKVIESTTAINKVTNNSRADVVVYNINGTEAARFTSTYGLVYATAADTDLPNGLYLLRIHTEAGTTVKKWLKK